jgi:hypothetical protein
MTDEGVARMGGTQTIEGKSGWGVVYTASGKRTGKQDQTTRPRIEIEGGRMLRLGVIGEDPKFKAILFPYVHGRGSEPKLAFTQNGDLVVEIGDQKDVITFVEGDTGRTGFTLVRENEDGTERFSFGRRTR